MLIVAATTTTTKSLLLFALESNVDRPARRGVYSNNRVELKLFLSSSWPKPDATLCPKKDPCSGTRCAPSPNNTLVYHCLVFHPLTTLNNLSFSNFSTVRNKATKGTHGRKSFPWATDCHVSGIPRRLLAQRTLTRLCGIFVLHSSFNVTFPWQLNMFSNNVTKKLTDVLRRQPVDAATASDLPAAMAPFDTMNPTYASVARRGDPNILFNATDFLDDKLDDESAYESPAQGPDEDTLPEEDDDDGIFEQETQGVLEVVAEDEEEVVEEDEQVPEDEDEEEQVPPPPGAPWSVDYEQLAQDQIHAAMESYKEHGKTLYQAIVAFVREANAIHAEYDDIYQAEQTESARLDAVEPKVLEFIHNTGGSGDGDKA